MRSKVICVHQGIPYRIYARDGKLVLVRNKGEVCAIIGAVQPDGDIPVDLKEYVPHQVMDMVEHHVYRYALRV